MNNINFLGEDNFAEAMENENARWRSDCTTQGEITTSDGIKLNYYSAVPANPKAVIALVHGFCEFWGKYHEYAWYLYQAGYAVYFLEQRGHGYSEGKCKEPDVVFIDDYDTYVEDYKIFVDTVIMPASKGMKRIIIAHSMGGAVATLFIEKYPDYFDGAILSSPMLKIKNDTPPILIKLLSIFSLLFGTRRKIAPGQRRFDYKPTFEISSTQSKPRYDYQFEMRKKDWHYQTYGASIGWGLASFYTNRRIMQHTSSIKIPVKIFIAGNDKLIDGAGYKEFAGLVPKAEFRTFEKAKHELFNDVEETRIQYYNEVLDTIEKYTKL